MTNNCNFCTPVLQPVSLIQHTTAPLPASLSSGCPKIRPMAVAVVGALSPGNEGATAVIPGRSSPPDSKMWCRSGKSREVIVFVADEIVAPTREKPTIRIPCWRLLESPHLVIAFASSCTVFRWLQRHVSFPVDGCLFPGAFIQVKGFHFWNCIDMVAGIRWRDSVLRYGFASASNCLSS